MIAPLAVWLKLNRTRLNLAVKRLIHIISVEFQNHLQLEKTDNAVWKMKRIFMKPNLND